MCRVKGIGCRRDFGPMHSRIKFEKIPIQGFTIANRAWAGGCGHSSCFAAAVRALLTQPNVETGTSQNMSGTFVDLGDRLRVGWLNGGRGAARAEDAQETTTQSQVSPSIQAYEDKSGLKLIEILNVTIELLCARKHYGRSKSTKNLFCFK